MQEPDSRRRCRQVQWGHRAMNADDASKVYHHLAHAEQPLLMILSELPHNTVSVTVSVEELQEVVKHVSSARMIVRQSTNTL